MGSRVEDLLSLAKMLDEGKVSQSEYEAVKAELLAAPAEEWLDSVPEPAVEFETEAPTADESPAETDSPRLDLATVLEGAINWGKALPPSLRWGAAALLVALFGIALFDGGDVPQVQAAGLPDAAAPIVEEPLVGSLGIRLQEIEQAWNDAGIPPQIRGAFALTPEPGPLDTFLYRFDQGAVVAGAYEPGEGVVYALMLRVGLGHEAISDLNSHLCHLLHPYDQACLDAFADETGVNGTSVSDFEGRDYAVEWSYEGNTWRLSISGDVETVRVIAPGQP